MGSPRFGDFAARAFKGRIAPPTATTTTIKALPVDSESRIDGCSTTVLDDSSVWIFDADSAAGASATVLVPDVGSGRFLKLVDPGGITPADLASNVNALGISLAGVEDPDGVITGTTGEAALVELAKRLLSSAANVTAIKALAAAKRVGGGLVVDLATYLVWQFDAGSSAAASARVLVPDVGTGRWVRKAGIEVAEKAVVFGDLTDADQQQTVDFASALPAGALVLGTGANVTATFDDVGDGATLTFDLGIKSGDTDVWIDGGSLNAVAKVYGPAGVAPVGLVGAVTPSIIFDADVNLNTLTKGAATFYVAYLEAF